MKGKSKKDSYTTNWRAVSVAMKEDAIKWSFKDCHLADKKKTPKRANAHFGAFKSNRKYKVPTRHLVDNWP